jgi:hypothetical protein
MKDKQIRRRPHTLRSAADDADPLADARRRGTAAKQRLLRVEGEPLSGSAVAAHLEITEADVAQRRRDGRLLGIATDDNDYVYPVWQFARHGIVSGLTDVLSELRDHDPWMQLAFFLTGDPRLAGEMPLAALRHGRIDAVRRAARAYGEQGAT